MLLLIRKKPVSLFCTKAYVRQNRLHSKGVNLEAAVNKYGEDRSSPELFGMKLTRWKNRYLTKVLKLRPAAPAVVIKGFDAALFPDVSILIQIAYTISVRIVNVKDVLARYVY